jgi:hypothetical protein
VFAKAAYQRSLRESLLAEFLQWLWNWIHRISQAIASTPGAAPVARFTLYTAVALLVVAVGYRVVRHYLETRGGTRLRFSGGVVADLWKDSERAAAQGNFTAAAHLLYAALLRRLVLRGTLRFHSSKTTGDYVRELRRTGGAVLVPFTTFVRAYEVVIYRDGTCDAERYTTLRALAEPIVHPARAAA